MYNMALGYIAGMAVMFVVMSHDLIQGTLFPPTVNDLEMAYLHGRLHHVQEMIVEIGAGSRDYCPARNDV